MTEHRICLHKVAILEWLAHCTCGGWGSYMGWASHRQAKDQWKKHRDGTLKENPAKSTEGWTCERLLDGIGPTTKGEA